ncbi:LysM peptidoglycan-binding domain-containing protein [Flavobacterium piscinae]|uniref:LysM peptidoglycan-binding domain-containing protein n=1 Tax=Flavobacterium piscinae TaxID=2506424 RepID=UPI001984F2DA|nr:LysM peptidoglycan-binding domain-containing protein [Flavobacterium piscinae]MBC8884472.1 LysM peptidoglycan-binding domain-containing protein [Flavobacterium piscinae]
MAQTSTYKKHIVVKGETITQIAQKYKVTPYDIYRLNPDAQNGIQENAVLLIPNSVITKVQNEEQKTHEVQPKETLFGIAKQYDTTVEELERLNPEVKTDGLKIGQTIQISGSKSEVVANVNINTKSVFHEVQPKETLYGISKQYNVSVEELEVLNPEVKSGLTIGQKLIITKGKTVDTTTSIPTKKIEVPNNGKYLTYEVKPKETLFGLAKMFRLSQDELIALNPEIKEGVREGMLLKVPSDVTFNLGTVREVKDLSKSIVRKKKKK